MLLNPSSSEGRHGKEIFNPTFLLGEEWGFLLNEFFLKHSLAQEDLESFGEKACEWSKK